MLGPRPVAVAVCLTAHVRDEQLAEVALVTDPSRPRKAVRGARSAGGERTWLRKHEAQPAAACSLPGGAAVHVSCGGHCFEFQLEHASARPSAGVLRKRTASGVEFELGSLLHAGFVVQLRFREAATGPSDAAFELDEAAITLPHDRPAGVAPPPADRTTARLEDALRAQHARCDQLSAQYDALAQALKERAQQSAAQADGEHDRLRCSLGEVCRLLRQAKHAEAELKQDVLARRQWDRYFSGEETRDVLENGVRRAHMEARLRREVTREDVEKSLQIPFAERARVIGVDPARDDASELRRLPFAAGPQL